MNMKSVIEILEELESTPSRLDKEEILDSNLENTLLQSVLIAAMDPYVHYGIAKFKMSPPIWRSLHDNTVLSDFVNNVLPPLISRAMTGNNAKTWVEESFSRMDERQQKWCKRILLQNLRAGIQTKTVNKTWVGLISTFEVQLAKTLDTLHENGKVTINEEIDYPVRVEPKLDGLRCIAIKKNGGVTMFSRNGRPVETLTTIKSILEKCSLDNFVLDGESMGDDWNESASIVGSKKNLKDDSNIFMNIFDAMPLEDWITQECNLQLGARSRLVTKIVNACGSLNVRQVSYEIVETEQELMNFYEKCLDEDYEGIMIKDPCGKYKFKRTSAMLKMKPIATYEGTVVGVYDGRDGTKHQGLFGGFHVLLPNGVITRCGGGYSDKLREEFQSNGLESYNGKIMELEGQPPLTKDGKVRFPVFQRWREACDVDPLVTEAYETYVESGQTPT